MKILFKAQCNCALGVENVVLLRICILIDYYTLIQVIEPI